MTDGSSPPLVDLDPIGDGTSVPIGAHEELRRSCPIARTADGSYYLARYDDVLQALRSVNNFVSNFRAPGVVVPDEERLISEIPEPRHGKVRRVLNTAIVGHRLTGIEEFAGALANELLAGLLERDEVDLLHDFIMPIPAAVICELLGTDPKDRAFWQQWSDEMAHDRYVRENRNDRGRAIAGCFPEASARFDEMISARRDSTDPDDFIGRLGQADMDGQRLTDLEMKMVLVFLFAAGNETTRNLLGNLLVKVATDPDFFGALRDDRRLVDVGIEESLRLNPPVPFLPRDCTSAVQIADVVFEAGDHTVFGVASANRDEREFEVPHEFRLDRPEPRRHLSFGAGAHVCPGATLARLETRAAVNALLDGVGAIVPAADWSPRKEPVWWTDGPHDIRVRLVAT